MGRLYCIGITANACACVCVCVEPHSHTHKRTHANTPRSKSIQNMHSAHTRYTEMAPITLVSSHIQFRWLAFAIRAVTHDTILLYKEKHTCALKCRSLVHRRAPTRNTIRRARDTHMRANFPDCRIAPHTQCHHPEPADEARPTAPTPHRMRVPLAYF